MVVDDFDIVRTALFPLEADPPLIIDPDAPLSDAVVPQLFQPVARRYPQIVHPLGGVEQTQPA
jgi:hypothetical protein